MLSSASGLRGHTFTCVPSLALPTATETVGASLTEPPRHPVKPEPPASVSALRLGERYDWIAAVADQPIDPTIFDKRSLTGLRRRRIRTWGDLGTLNDAALLEIANVGELTVSRIHKALTEHGAKATSRSAVATYLSTAAVAPVPGPEPADLRIAAEWASVVTDDTTLCGLVKACVNDDGIPKQAGDAVANLLAVPFARLSGHETTPLAERIDDLLAEASDPGLLAAREFQQARPTWATLGRDRDVTGEAVRRKVARDALMIRGLLASDRFRPVRWAAERLRAEFGIAVRADSDVVEGWRARLGEIRFEALRWIARYVYDDDWLLLGANTTRSGLAHALDAAASDEWLFKAAHLVCRLPGFVRPEAALSLLLESGVWRDIGDGWLVRWDGPLQAKAERVLALVGRPMTPAELVEAIGYGSEGTLKNKPRSLVRVDKNFHLALPEWGYEEYEGITTEIKQRIERGGGVASRAAMIEEFTLNFRVSVSSVLTYLKLPIFDVDGDAVRLTDAPSFTPQPPSTVPGAVRTQHGWGGRLIVTEDTTKGYSFTVSPHIAWANGIRPEDSLRVPVNGSPAHAASVIWRTTDPSGDVEVGRLREWLTERGAGPGAEIVVCPTRERVTIYVGADEIGAARRAFEAAAPMVAPEIAALMEDL